MDLNTVLLILVVGSCIASLLGYRNNPYRQYLRTWVVINLLVLAIAGIAYSINPENTGIIAAIPWIVLLEIPEYSSKYVSRLVYQRRYKQAAQWAWITAILHPTRVNRVFPSILNALHLAQNGKFDEAEQQIFRHEISSLWLHWARGEFYHLSKRWAELRVWLEQEPALTTNLLYLGYYIRALGEIGDLNKMLEVYQQHRELIQRDNTFLSFAVILLVFTGRTTTLQLLLNWTPQKYPDHLQQYWQGTAEIAAGNINVGEEMLHRSTPNADTLSQQALDYRLAHPPALAKEILTDRSESILQTLEQDIEQYQKIYVPPAPQRRPYITYTLIAVNVLVFIVVTIQGSSTDVRILFEMGALVPRIMGFYGEWWRLLTALFLHYGFIHLLLNMLALHWLGTIIESQLGRWRLLIIYFSAGIGSMLGIIVASDLEIIQAGIVVGASGAIMGLLGADAATRFWVWQRERSAIARRELIPLIVILLIQVFIDVFVIPQSSLTGHLSGLFIGFSVASLLWFTMRRAT